MEYLWRAAVILLTSTYALSMILGIYFMFIHPEGYSFSWRLTESLPIGFLTMFIVRIPLSVPFGLVFIFIWILYILCFTFAWMDDGGFLNSMKSGHVNFLSRPSNFLYVLPALSSLLLILVVIIQDLQEAAGVPTGSVEFKNLYRGLFDLAYSPIFEEFMYRISPFTVYITVKLTLHTHIPRHIPLRSLIKNFLTSILFPDRFKEVFGWPSVRRVGILRGISLGEWMLVLVTSIIFGLAHYLSGSGWEAGKVTSAFLAGLIFFIAYLTFGFYAPVLLHWFFNYYFHIYIVAVENYDGLFELLERLINSTIEIIGFATIIILLTKFLRQILKRCRGLSNL
ncbi:MAG: CPBP family glutamic-type intramembrane protease [Candidatus Bathyarchaeia archaeon]